MAVKRLPARSSERGAALFVVVLIVALLTAIGAFAAHATALTQTAAGYSRRASSAFYVGEFATNLLAADIAAKGDIYNGVNSGAANCLATLGSTTGASCYAPSRSDLERDIDTAIKSDPDGALFGALSRPDRPADHAVRANYRIEMTEKEPATEPLPGQSTSANVTRATLTITAHLSPFTAGANCSEDTSRASETQSFRAYVIFQPPKSTGSN